MRRTRVLVVDDSPLLRQIVSDMLRGAPDLEVVGHGRDGEEAVRLVAELRPDVVTLDVEMPRMNGLEALRAIMASHPTPVVMCSTLTAEGTATTLEALEVGAVDFVGKPNNGSLVTIRTVGEELIEKVRHARFAKLGARPIRPKRAKIVESVGGADRVVVVASSTGGPRALTALFSSLPKGFPAPILVAQHMPAGFTASLARRLNGLRTVPVAEAQPGDRVTPGRALIAPGGAHLRVLGDGSLEFSVEPPLHGVRPAADHLFTSAAAAFGNRCLGVVLTGMGRDGTAGALAIQAAGGRVLAESEETCTVYGMPRIAAESGAVSLQVPIDRMAGAIVEALGGGASVAA